MSDQAAESQSKTLAFNKQVSLDAMTNALSALRAHKPNDRSEQDRYWAIVITDLEKSIAVFKTYVMT